MAIYRFRVTFEDYEDVYREIDMLSKQTFLDLHQAIHKTTGYETEVSSSFYVSNDQWKKGTEIALFPTERKIETDVLLMEGIRLSKFIDDPHQKFYYVYNFDRPYDFHVELIKILKEEDGKEYPTVFKTIGVAPKSLGGAPVPAVPVEEDDAEYEEEETQYGVDEEDDFDMFDDEQGEEGGEESGRQSGVEDEY